MQSVTGAAHIALRGHCVEGQGCRSCICRAAAGRLLLQARLPLQLLASILEIAPQQRRKYRSLQVGRICLTRQ
jgi:hypothetical protein